MKDKDVFDIAKTISKPHDYVTIAAWAADFTYALDDRPWIFKLLFRIAIGKFAWREFMGMVIAMVQNGSFIPGFGYSLQNQEYHKDKLSMWGLK